MKRFLILFISATLLICCFGCKKETDSSEVPEPTEIPIEETPAVLPKDTDALEQSDIDFKVYFLKVGKADSAIIVADGKNYLVDAGTEESAIAVLAGLHTLGISKLDGVFLTHTHSDHIGGFAAIAENIPVERIYRSNFSEGKKNGDNKIDNLGKKFDIQVSTLAAGDMVLISDRCLAEVLGPTELNTKDDNDNSLVLCFCYQNAFVLMTGDMQFEEEKCIIQKWGALQSDILKVGNHGNPDSNSAEFLENVNPTYAVISTDRSVDEDSANPVILERLSDADVTITDETENGVLFTLQEDDSFQKEFPTLEKQNLNVQITDVNAKTQTLTLTNTGSSDADLSHCMVYSMKGNEVYVFPDKTVLKAGESLVLGPAGGEGDYLWKTEKKPWSTKKTDSAVLYDSYGNIVCRFN